MTLSPNARDRRRITVEIPATLYAAVVAAKVWSGRTINDLTQEGLELMADRYRKQRRAHHPSHSSKPEGPST